MSAYTDFFLNSKSNVVQLELLEMYHPNFSKTYRLVRNATNGITVKLEDGLYYTFDYVPLKISLSNELDNLDQTVKIQMGDLGELIPKEMDAVSKSNGFTTKPTLKYRNFRSDDLNNVLFGPLDLEIKTFSFNRDGCIFEAKAPSININKTGEIYSIDRFPMLRGLL